LGAHDLLRRRFHPGAVAASISGTGGCRVQGKSMKIREWGAALCMALLASGCAFNEQAVRVTPQVDVAPGTVGEGVAVRVNVVDERPRTTLGTRGARGGGADLTVEGDLVSILRGAIETGLQRLSFETTQDPAQERELRVELRALD